MKILVVGAGGVGSYYGGTLAHAGNDLFFIARGRRLAALLAGRLKVESYLGNFAVAVSAGERADDFGHADLILICVKSYDLTASLDCITPNIGPKTVIIPLQNGVVSEAICAARYGNDRVVGGVAFIGVALRDELVQHTAHGHLSIGEMDGTESQRLRDIAALFVQASVQCHLSRDIRRALYAKMVWNIGFNALSALHNVSANHIAADPALSAEAMGAMREWIEVAQLKGVALKESIAQKNIDVTLQGREIIPSMLQDIRNGARLETDIFNAYVVTQGRKLGVSTPINREIADKIAPMQGGSLR